MAGCKCGSATDITCVILLRPVTIIKNSRTGTFDAGKKINLLLISIAVRLKLKSSKGALYGDALRHYRACATPVIVGRDRKCINTDMCERKNRNGVGDAPRKVAAIGCNVPVIDYKRICTGCCTGCGATHKHLYGFVCTGTGRGTETDGVDVGRGCNDNRIYKGGVNAAVRCLNNKVGIVNALIWISKGV